MRTKKKKWKKTEGGLVYPEQPPETPPRDYGLLEIRCESSREEASKALATLRNIGEIRGGLLCMDKKRADAQDKIILALAKQLLGEDWECEILC
jgi:hypothetical protein